MTTTVHLLTYEEWLQWPEHGEGREECVNGVIETMAPPKWKHLLIVEKLAKKLRACVDEDTIFVVTSEFGLVIRTNPITQRTPDIAVFIEKNMVIKDGYVHSAPELAVEVLSPANTPKRIRGKLADYASIVIPEVWVLDPDAQTVSIHRLNNDVYDLTLLPHNGATSLLSFPSSIVDFSTIWP